MKAVRSSRRAIRIVSQCATAEEFVAAFHPYLERDSLFIATGSPEEPGQAIRFVMTLAGGETMLRGAGRVLECHRDRGNFYGLRGMKVQFDELDDGSRRALAALESRASGRQSRSPAAAAGHANDVLECLIYDEPNPESADPSAAGNSRGRPARPGAERGMPAQSAGDDDVTAVAVAPPRPPRGQGQVAGRGTGPVPRQGGSPRAQRTSSPAPIPPGAHPNAHPGAHPNAHPNPHPNAHPNAHQHTPRPAPHAAAPRDDRRDGRLDDHAGGFHVPRPRSDPGGLQAEPPPPPGHNPHAGHDMSGRGPSSRMGVIGSGADPSDMPTDMMPAARPRAAPAPSVQVAPPPPTPALQGAGSGPLLDYDHTESSRPRMPGGVAREDLGLGTGPPHLVPGPPELSPFPPGEFGMPPTRPGGRRGMPRPPMPAERTEIVRVVRPSHVRTAALSATLGVLLGLSAGYLLWGMDRIAFGIGGSSEDEQAGAQVPTGPAQDRENSDDGDAKGDARGDARGDDRGDEPTPVQARPAATGASDEAEVRPARTRDADAGADPPRSPR